MRNLLFITLVLFTLQMEAKNFYGIIMADIDDPTIGAACERDANKMDAEFKRFAIHNNSLHIIKEFKGNKFSKKRLFNYLNEINPQKDDVIFFYYSGHGKYEEGLGKVLTVNDAYLELKEVEEILESKSADLKFIVTDCCSQRIPFGYVEQENTNDLEFITKGLNESSKAGVLMRRRNYQRLLNYEGLLVLESSQPGQYSYAYDNGGIFTDFFLKAIHEQVEFRDTNWKQIIDSTREKVENFVEDNLEKNQIPVCDDTNLYQKLSSGNANNIDPSKHIRTIKN